LLLLSIVYLEFKEAKNQNIPTEMVWCWIFLALHPMIRICKVGDCGLQTYQTATILKRATTLKFTTISPILYIHCVRPAWAAAHLL
jgi:hypothetical protein